MKYENTLQQGPSKRYVIMEESKVVSKSEKEMENKTEVEEGELSERCHICGKRLENWDKHMVANHRGVSRCG